MVVVVVGAEELLVLREGVLSKTSGSGRDFSGETSSAGAAALCRRVATIVLCSLLLFGGDVP